MSAMATDDASGAQRKAFVTAQTDASLMALPRSFCMTVAL